VLSRFREPIDAAFDHVAAVFDKAGVSPNTVSVLGLVLSGIGGVLIARGTLVAGAAIAGVGGILDLVDGILARRSGQETAIGGYLDSVLDRYTDAFAFAAIAWYYATQWIWAAAILGYLGAVATSYAKARLYEDVRPDPDRSWAQLVEHPERLLALLFGAGFQGISDAIGYSVQFLPWVLLAVAVFGHVTVIQRTLIAKHAIEEAQHGHE